MPYSRPTLTQLRTQVAQDIAGALRGADALLRWANLTIIGRVQAGLANLQFGYLDWIARMAVPFTAAGEYLLGWGALKGVMLKEATFAGGDTTADGAVRLSGIALTPIPLNTPLVRGDGLIYLTSVLTEIGGGGTVDVPAICETAGATGNTAVDSKMTLGASIPGVNTEGVVVTAFRGGADQETMDDYKSRMLQVYRNTPQGGAAADYIRWALEVPGVTRAWCDPLGAGVGTVVVYTMWDVVEAAFDGFPQGTNGVATNETRGSPATGDQLEVADYIFGSDTIGRQPVTALVYSVAPIANEIDFEIDHIAGVSADIKAKIVLAIKGVFIEQGAPGEEIDLSAIEAAIAAIPGTAGFVITDPVDNIANPAGNLPKLGTITYT